MKNRRYFTCPIQALYMIKEFGVKFEMRHTPEQIRDCDLQEEDIFYPFDHLDIRQPEHIESLVEEFENVKKIYVAPKSEAIFEPKERDGILAYGDTFFSISTEVAERGIFRHGVISLDRVQMIDNPQITVRDDKHFFMGELENETQH
jgi:hypothetical protein